MRRHRRKSSSSSPILWLCALALIAWGIYSARKIWTDVDAAPIPIAATTDDPAPAPPPPTADPPTPPTPARYTIDGLTTAVSFLPDDDAVPLEPPLDPKLTFDPALTADDLRAMGTHLLQTGDMVRARYAFNAALARTRDQAAAQSLRDTLQSLNTPVFLGNAILPEDPGAGLVEIQSGDSFVKIAHDYAVTGAFLQSLNPSLNPKHLKPDTGMKVVQGPFNVHVIKHAARLDLFARDMYVRSFSVQFPEGNSLLAGEYHVARDGKVDLGPKRWIQFEGTQPATETVSSGWIFGSAGPHGTTPKDRSTGIRLADADLAALYNMLVEQRSRILVEP